PRADGFPSVTGVLSWYALPPHSSPWQRQRLKLRHVLHAATLADLPGAIAAADPHAAVGFQDQAVIAARGNGDHALGNLHRAALIGRIADPQLAVAVVAKHQHVALLIQQQVVKAAGADSANAAQQLKGLLA